MQFSDFLNEKSIINCLIKDRIKLCLKEDERNFYSNFSPQKKDNVGKKSSNFNSEENQLIMSCFPPRKHWNRYRPKVRKKLTPKTLLEITLRQCIDSMFFKERERFKNEKWCINLNNLLISITQKVFSEEFSFTPPFIIAALKSINKDDKTQKTFRPITKFELVDKIIISLTAKYFVDLFDPLFHDDYSYAFRSKKSGIAYSHHFAVEKILNFVKSNSTKTLYVAECDIMKFYDSVEHSLIMEKLLDLSKSLSYKIDSNAFKVFKAYLKCYSFNNSVLDKEEIIKKNNNEDFGRFEWIKNDLIKNYGESHLNKEIGVPQGGALSCFISNLILHFADCKIDLESNKKTDLYIRYCDDMIIISSSLKKCKSLFQLYKQSLNELYLIPQESQEIIEYSKEFWNIKNSKNPYKWEESPTKKSVPWLSFLGYQIKRDCTLRVRKKSVVKEIEKQNKVCSKITLFLKKSIKRDEVTQLRKKQIIFRLRKKLISMSVGRINETSDDNSFCWVDGFRLCLKHKTDLKFAKQLDKNRVRQLGRIKKIIKIIKQPQNKGVHQLDNLFKVDGYKQSYYRQFIKDKK